MRIARTGFLAGLLLSLVVPAAPAAAATPRVQVDVRLEKVRYLAGEPVFVVTEVRNVGDEAIKYEPCDRRVELEVLGTERRKLPNLLGCDDMGMGRAGTGCGSSHHPLLQPGQSMTSRHLLTDYDLKPGRYQLTASGKAGLIGEIAGAPFTTTVSLEVVAASQRELQAAFAPLVAAAGHTTGDEWRHARAAIAESAPPFLESLIARFAADGHDDAIKALGRLATTSSRAHLKAMFGTSKVNSRPSIVLALARVGHRDDFEFFATVLEDSKEEERTRGYAALGLGRLGGAAAARRLERAVRTASSELRKDVIIALGNTGSALAVPVLIRLYANDDHQSLVCRGLRILTHRHLCGRINEAAAWRRKTERWWAANSAKVPIYGLDNCRANPVRPTADVDPTPAPVVEQKAPLGPPRIVEVVPSLIAPNTNFTVNGFDMDVDVRKSVTVSFTQGSLVRTAERGGSGGIDLPGGDGSFAEFVAPAALSPGKWQLVIDADGRRSAPVDAEIIRPPDVELVAIFPSIAHPAHSVEIDTKSPPPVDVFVQLTDARGRQWRIEPGVVRTGIGVGLPEDIADGEANIRVGRIDNGSERWSAPITFAVTSGPLPLTESAVTGMIPVAPGQWSDLVVADTDGWEVNRVDRVDVEFRQGDVTIVSPASLPANTHVRVPPRLKPGAVTMRTRTWIEQTASAWSPPATITLLERPVPPMITGIYRAFGDYLWSSEQSADSAKGFIDVRAGQSLRVYGHFPVADRRDLMFRLRSSRATVKLPMRIEDTEILIDVPSQLPPQTVPEDWMLVVGTRDRGAPTRDITAVRIR